MNFAPVVDVNTNPNNPIIGNRSFGENQENVADKSIAFTKGMQRMNVVASAKHFPGHGDTATDSHHTLPLLDRRIQRRSSIGWNDAGLVGHFDDNHHVARGLNDLDTVVVVARQHRNRQATCDAPIPAVEVFDAIEYGLARSIAAAHLSLDLHASLGELGEAPIRRIDYQRRKPQCLACGIGHRDSSRKEA